tara:strand:+ start:511 stop:843 length:333 start_codon:yes stop_codon:yes gene_type:complete
MSKPPFKEPETPAELLAALGYARREIRAAEKQRTAAIEAHRRAGGDFVVRLYDGFDRLWMDVTGPLSHKDATVKWLAETQGGTKNTCYEDIDLLHFSCGYGHVAFNRRHP